MYVAGNLKLLMNRYDISGKKLAEEMGWGANVITSYRTGTLPPLDKASKLAGYFNVSLEDFVNTDMSKSGITQLPGSKGSESLLIELLAKEVHRLREQIDRKGSKIDRQMADEAIDDAIEGLKRERG